MDNNNGRFQIIAFITKSNVPKMTTEAICCPDMDHTAILVECKGPKMP